MCNTHNLHYTFSTIIDHSLPVLHIHHTDRIPPVVNVKHPSTSRVSSGSRLEYVCEATGKPTPTITWTR